MGFPNHRRLDPDHAFTVALSHDVDRVHKSFQSLTHFARHFVQGRFGPALYQLRSIGRSETYWCFDTIRAIEDRYGVKSTYFFLNESYPLSLRDRGSWRLALGYYSIFQPKVSAVIRQLDGDGFEIGLHGSYRSYCDRRLLEKEKSDLESILGRPVEGVRQHYLNLAPDTWSMQRGLGFCYDASFGHRDRVGFKDDVFRPFFLDERRDFLVVPQAIMDCCLMRSRDPWREASATLDAAERGRALLVLNWHQQIFDEREYPGYSEMYVQILDECVSRGARFTTLGAAVHAQLRQGSEAMQ